MAGRIETFVIHLERAVGRRALVDALLVGTPYPAQIVPAVDGRALASFDGIVSSQAMFSPPYPFALSAGEIGCFLSHRLAWRRIVDEGLEAALILEDDVALLPEFTNSVQRVAENIAELGYVQFQVRAVREGVVLAETEGTRIIRPIVTPLRTSAQMVSNEAARRLLEVSELFDRPVDTFLQMHWQTGLHLSCVVPSGVTDQTVQTGGSTISQSKGPWEKVKREWRRARYRRAVQRLSQ